MIERAARDPNVDIDKMERLFQMRERMELRAAEGAFNTAMAAAQSELKPVVRNKTNTQTNSNYADLEALARAVDPIIHKHGFGLSFGEFAASKPGHVGVTVDVMHAGGHSRSYKYEIPADGVGLKGNANKTATHAYGSSLSYGRRYAKLSVFDVATKDDDGQAAARGPTINDEQTETLRELVESVDGSTDEFCAYFKIGKISELPAAKYDAALKAVKKRGGLS